MDHLEAISEDEFVASFLAGEIDSARFGDALLTLIRKKGWDLALVTDPRLGDAEECDCRRRLLAQHRGFGFDREFFDRRNTRDHIQPIYQPTFVTAEAATLEPDALVMGLVIDGEAMMVVPIF